MKTYRPILTAIAFMVLASLACSALTGQPSPPTAVPSATNSPTPTLSRPLPTRTSTATSTPTLTSTEPSVYQSDNIVVLADAENGSLFLIDTKGKAYACPKLWCTNEKEVAKLIGAGNELQFVMWYDTANQVYKVVQLESTPTKLWFAKNILYTCTDPCEGEYEYINGELMSHTIKRLNDAMQTTTSDLLTKYRKWADAGETCIASNAHHGAVYHCKRVSSTPGPTIPTITPTALNTPTRVIRP